VEAFIDEKKFTGRAAFNVEYCTHREVDGVEEVEHVSPLEQQRPSDFLVILHPPELLPAFDDMADGVIAQFLNHCCFVSVQYGTRINQFERAGGRENERIVQWLSLGCFDFFVCGCSRPLSKRNAKVDPVKVRNDPPSKEVPRDMSES